MKILELLSEIEEVIDTASGVPLTQKVVIDPNDILEIVKDIRDSLDSSIEQAKWILNEKDRILTEAKKEYETVISDAKRHAESLVEKDEVLVKTRQRAEELMRTTEINCKKLKMGTYDYVDGILYEFQNKMDYLSSIYFNEMFKDLENTFQKINATINENRDEIKSMAYHAQIKPDTVEKE